jgi:hypothetical protein
MRRLWALWIAAGLIVLLLAACNGDDKKDQKDTDNPNVVPPDSTEEVGPPPVEVGKITPGLKVRSGLTVVSLNEGIENGTLYFYAEMRNDTDQYFKVVEAFLYLLNEQSVQIDTVPMTTLLTDIPPGQIFYVGRELPVPEKYADAQRWLWYDPVEEPSLTAYFALPATVEFQGAVEGAAYLVRGQTENNTGKELAFPIIDVVLFNSEGKPIGLTHGVIQVSRADGMWPAGEVAPFEAAFAFVAGGGEQVTQVKVLSAGYTQREP